MATGIAQIENRHRSFEWVGFVACLVITCVLWTLVIGLYDPAFSAEDLQQTKWNIGIRNAIPITLLSVLLWTWTRRPFLSLWISAIVLRLLYSANALKLEHLETPLLPTDFKVIGSNFGGGLMLHYLPSELHHLLASLIATLVLAGLLLESPTAWLRGTRRGVIAGIGMLLMATLLVGIKPWRMIYPRDLLEFQSWSPNHSMEHAGLVAGLLRYHWEFSGTENEPDRAVARDLLVRYRDAWAPATSSAASDVAALPDIVVVQSESFFNPARLNGIERGRFMQNYRALAAHSQHGDLRVPAYGGGTIRTEFEVLTGLAMRYFPQDEYPYFRLTDKPLRGLATVLGEHGYQTLAIHPNDPAFWNRGAALRSLGFDEFSSMSDFDTAEHDGWFVTDSELSRSIVRQLPVDGPPRFVFAISMGAHGPYDQPPINDPARRDAIAVPDSLPPRNASRLRNYLYKLENADRALGELVAEIKQRPRRTLLLFYGDHLPALPTTYAYLGFRDGKAANVQTVPWLLFDSAKPRGGAQHIDSASFFLAGQLLSAAGINDDPYFRLSEAIREKTQFEAGFTPAEDTGLSSLMPLRQRAHDQDLIRDILDGKSPGPAALATSPP